MSTKTFQGTKPAKPTTTEFCRPLYVRQVPEHIWLRVHDNAHRSRMRLQTYIVRILETSEPFPPLPKAPAKASNGQATSPPC